MPPAMPTITKGMILTSDLTETLPRYAQMALQSAQMAMSKVRPEAWWAGITAVSVAMESSPAPEARDLSMPNSTAAKAIARYVVGSMGSCLKGRWDKTRPV